MSALRWGRGWLPCHPAGRSWTGLADFQTAERRRTDGQRQNTESEEGSSRLHMLPRLPSHPVD